METWKGQKMVEKGKEQQVKLIQERVKSSAVVREHIPNHERQVNKKKGNPLETLIRKKLEQKKT